MARHSHNFKDIFNQKFGKLRVLQYAGTYGKTSKWLCECECGNLAIVSGAKLRNGHTQSCGCIQSQKTVSRNTKHGLSKTSEYGIWGAIKDRTTRDATRYSRYGKRGIRMCAGWFNDFANFYADMGPKPSDEHSIDRIDFDGHYSCGHCDECLANGWPANCRWATRSEQARNKSSNRMLVYNGQEMTITDLAKLTGIHHSTLHHRIVKNGMTPELAVSDNRPDRRKQSKPGSLRSIAEQNGISYDLFHDKVKNAGMSVEDAVSYVKEHQRRSSSETLASKS